MPVAIELGSLPPARRPPGRTAADAHLRLPSGRRDDLATSRRPTCEVALRLGHSVETLVSTYVGALNGDERLANARIEASLAHPSNLTTLQGSSVRPLQARCETGSGRGDELHVVFVVPL